MSDETPLVIPELIGDDWKVNGVNDLAAKTDLYNHVMWAPNNGGWLEGGVQLHEMAHVKWTPREKYTDDPEMLPNGHAASQDLELLIQATEDRRIHHLLSESVSDWPQYGKAMISYCQQVDTSSMKPEVQVALEVAGRQVGGEPITELDGKLKEIADFAEKIILDDATNPQVTWDAAKFIRDSLKGDGEPEGEGDSKASSGDDDEDSDECSDPDCDCHYDDDDDQDDYDEDEDDDDDDEKPKSWLPMEHKLKPEYERPSSPGAPTDYNVDYREDPRSSGWCEMAVVRPELTVSIPRERVIARGSKMAKTGVRPRHVHRALTGGNIFVVKKKGRRTGGTVLLDVSGSMSVSDRDIENLLKEIKHGTVAMYESDGYRTGSLTIIAKDFQTVKSVRDYKMGGGNGVDGPALRWLSERPEPRAWICDGVTTGVGDSMYGRDECAKLEKQHRITRYNSIYAYLEERPAVGLTRHD